MLLQIDNKYQIGLEVQQVFLEVDPVHDKHMGEIKIKSL